MVFGGRHLPECLAENKRGENYIETHGVYISTRKEQGGENRWVVEIDTDLCLRQEGELVHRLFDGDRVLAASESVVTEKDGRAKPAATLRGKPRPVEPGDPQTL